MVQAKVNLVGGVADEKRFEISEGEKGLLVNGKPFQWDNVKIAEGFFHILHQNKSYSAEVIAIDKVAKRFTIRINGKNFTVDIKEKFDLLLEQMGMNSSATSKINHVKAPMPGLIIELKIKAGDVVKPGDQLLILEAMKMENILKSPGEGTVRNVKIKKGDSVEKGQVLIEF